MKKFIDIVISTNNKICNRFKLVFSRLFDGSKQQIARRLILIVAAIIIGMYFIISLNITPGSDKDGLVSVKEAQSKTDLEIIKDNNVAENNNNFKTDNGSEIDNKHNQDESKNTDNKNNKDNNNKDNNIESNSNKGKEETQNNNASNSTSSDSNKNVESNTVNSIDNTINKPDNTELNNTVSPTKNSSKQEENKSTKKPPIATTKPDKITCSIEIICDRASENIDLVENPEVKKYIPENGVILDKTSISINEGSSVYEVLVAIAAKTNIHVDATYNKMYKTAYIKGINHLYEKDVKSTSGWVFLVNKKTPSVGCGSYIVNDGDEITWAYSVEGYGEDI